MRYAYARDLDAYIRGVATGAPMLSESERIPPLDRDTEYVMLGLRLREGLDPKEFERRFRRRFNCFGPFLEQCRQNGYACEEEGRWHLTPKGFLVSNQIIGGHAGRPGPGQAPPGRRPPHGAISGWSCEKRGRRTRRLPVSFCFLQRVTRMAFTGQPLATSKARRSWAPSGLGLHHGHAALYRENPRHRCRAHAAADAPLCVHRYRHRSYRLSQPPSRKSRMSIPRLRRRDRAPYSRTGRRKP